jgi:serine protease Do
MNIHLKPIRALTCEDIVNPRHRTNLLWPGKNGNPYQFLVQEPFGLRRAIVPVFLAAGVGPLIGIGTAFHVDHWGTLVTADHVIEGLRERVKFGPFREDEQQTYEMGPTDLHPFVVFGGVVVYGRARLPDGMVARISMVKSQLRQSDDPLAAIQGRSNAEVAMDIALLKTSGWPPRPWRDTLPIRVSGWRPNRGETVVAVGFLEITSEILNEQTALHSLSEGMYAAYGSITAAYPNGRDRTNPTPVIEVEADWPSGMSGGPVFNESGEVIGIVSRSLESAQPGSRGHGWAACFQLMPTLRKFLPMIDPANPDRRLGWAVLRRHPWRLEAFCETQSEGHEFLNSLDKDFELIFGSNRVGTDEFVESELPHQ